MKEKTRRLLAAMILGVVFPATIMFFLFFSSFSPLLSGWSFFILYPTLSVLGGAISIYFLNPPKKSKTILIGGIAGFCITVSPLPYYATVLLLLSYGEGAEDLFRIVIGPFLVAFVVPGILFGTFGGLITHFLRKMWENKNSKKI